MRKRARTDLCGGRSAMVVPTATVSRRFSVFVPTKRRSRLRLGPEVEETSPPLRSDRQRPAWPGSPFWELLVCGTPGNNCHQGSGPRANFRLADNTPRIANFQLVSVAAISRQVGPLELFDSSHCLAATRTKSRKYAFRWLPQKRQSRGDDVVYGRVLGSCGLAGQNSPATARSCNSQGDAPALRAATIFSGSTWAIIIPPETLRCSVAVQASL